MQTYCRSIHTCQKSTREISWHTPFNKVCWDLAISLHLLLFNCGRFPIPLNCHRQHKPSLAGFMGPSVTYGRLKWPSPVASKLLWLNKFPIYRRTLGQERNLGFGGGQIKPKTALILHVFTAILLLTRLVKNLLLKIFT